MTSVSAAQRSVCFVPRRRSGEPAQARGGEVVGVALRAAGVGVGSRRASRSSATKQEQEPVDEPQQGVVEVLERASLSSRRRRSSVLAGC